MLVADGVTPGNGDQGYVLRRLLRRAVRYADSLGCPTDSLAKIADAVVETYRGVYPNVAAGREKIIATISEEETKFRKTLSLGLLRLEKILARNLDTGETVEREVASAQLVFDLYQSYGFPPEMTYEILSERGIKMLPDIQTRVSALLTEHEEKSRAGADAKFKGGLGDTGEVSVRYHTATHLLHQALRDVLGEHVQQKGSNITSERLRFDFAHPQKMTDEEKAQVEAIVNEKIAAKLPMNQAVLPKAEAEASGALHFFGEKYPESVSVYFIGNSLETAYSKEFCGGPHVKNTGELGHFKIQKEEAVAAGVRRIKAVLG